MPNYDKPNTGPNSSKQTHANGPLNRPRSAGPYPDRDIACQEALEQTFLDIAKGLTPEMVVETASGRLPVPLIRLAREAEMIGWTLEEAEVAISELAQNLLDDMAEM
jgi:hypothetical protein